MVTLSLLSGFLDNFDEGLDSNPSNSNYLTLPWQLYVVPKVFRSSLPGKSEEPLEQAMRCRLICFIGNDGAASFFDEDLFGFVQGIERFSLL